MTGNRCFRIDDLDVDSLRDQTHDRVLIDAFSNWIRKFAPHVDTVIDKISAAFANIELGDGVGLFEANGLDDYASEEELRRLRTSDEKLDWNRMSPIDLSECYCSPSFFDPKGFIFHLPAFLIAQLNDEHPYEFVERMYRAEEHPQGWQALLTNEQREAIITVLELIREHPEYLQSLDEIDAAIERFRHTRTSG